MFKDFFFYFVFIEIGNLVNDFIVLDKVLDGLSYDNNNFLYVISFSNNEMDAVFWHARLGHIMQERMHRLTRMSMLGLLTKVKLPI